MKVNTDNVYSLYRYQRTTQLMLQNVNEVNRERTPITAASSVNGWTRQNGLITKLQTLQTFRLPQSIEVHVDVDKYSALQPAIVFLNVKVGQGGKFGTSKGNFEIMKNYAFPKS